VIRSGKAHFRPSSPGDFGPTKVSVLE